MKARLNRKYAQLGVASAALLFLLQLAFSAAAVEQNTAEESERLRIQQRLQLVHELLLLRPVNHLNDAQQAERQKNLENLGRYWRRGVFPKNTRHPGHRVPYWIDDEGNYCAAAFLVSESGNDHLAKRIARTQNNLFLEQMTDPELASWVNTSGLSLTELQLIQPTYAEPGTMQYCVQANSISQCKNVLKNMSNRQKARHIEQLKYAKDIKMPKFLLAQGVPPSGNGFRKDFGWGGSPLWNAYSRSWITYGSAPNDGKKRIEILKKAGAKLLVSEQFLLAIHDNDLKKMRDLLLDNPELNKLIEPNPHRKRHSLAGYDWPLRVAARYGDEKTVGFLLRLGADPNETDIYGKNVFVIALQAKNYAALRALDKTLQKSQ